MSRATAKIDLTQGPIFSRALRFALPICIGSILQQLYGTVDTLVVGNFCGATALAAVGTATMPVEMLLCLFVGLGTGVSILVSQATGGGDTARIRSVIQNTNAFLYLCGIPLTLVGVLLGHLILQLMQTPADTWDQAVAYTRIMFLGTMGNLGYNINAGILRGVGDSASTLRFLLVSCLTNIVLDLLLVAVLPMGVSGAALATIIAMYVSWLASTLYIRKKYPELGYTLVPRKSDISRECLKEVARVSLPLGLNHSIYSVGHLFLQAFINGQGSVFMAACSVGSKINNLANITVQSLSSACSAFSGQNLGARRYDRLAKGGWQLPLFAGGLAMACGVIVTIFSRPLLMLFNSDPDVLAMAEQYVRCTLPLVWAFAVLTCIMNIAYGMGVMRYPTMVNILMLWAVRIPVAWAITTFWDGTYLMLSYPISFFSGMTAMLLFYCSHPWKEVRGHAREWNS